MSACAAYFRTGELEAVAAFPELPGLAERGLADGVGRLYLDMAARGELMQAGRRVSDVGELLREALRRWGRPVAVAADRWKIAELTEKLEAVRFPVSDLVTRAKGSRMAAKMSDTSGRPCCLTRCAPRQAFCCLLRWLRLEPRLTLPAITSWPSGAKAAGVLKRGMMLRPPVFWLSRLAGVAGPWVLSAPAGGPWGWHDMALKASNLRRFRMAFRAPRFWPASWRLWEQVAEQVTALGMAASRSGWMVLGHSEQVIAAFVVVRLLIYNL